MGKTPHFFHDNGTSKPRFLDVKGGYHKNGDSGDGGSEFMVI